MTEQNSIKLAVQADITQDKGTAKRLLSGIVNSGRPFDHYGELTVADLSDIEFKVVVPVLIDHDRGKRVATSSLSVSDKGLEVNGTLLSNEHGQGVAKDADEGFPFEMSTHLQYAATEALQAGETAMVNGHEVTGPIKILKKCRVREVSLTPTGVDYNTAAVVLADDFKQAKPQPTPPKQEHSMTLEQAIAEIEKLKARLDAVEKENEAIKKENEALKKSEHEAEVEAKLSAAGFKKAQDGKGWQGLSNDTYEVLLSLESKAAGAMIADLAPKDTDKKVPEVLLGEQYQQPSHGGDAKLSDNPLLANAHKRSKENSGYI